MAGERVKTAEACRTCRGAVWVRCPTCGGGGKENGGTDPHTKTLQALAGIVAQEGLDGILRMIVLACEIQAREADQGKPRDERAVDRWRARARHTRSYTAMAQTVEGRLTR